MAASRTALVLLALVAVARAQNAAAPIADQVNILKQGLPIPKNTLGCTPWSWAVCEQSAKGVYKVGVNAVGGGGMQAPQHYVNGEFSLDMKLPAGYSGGTNFAWYLMDTISASNKDPLHSEIDIEFYGNDTSKDVMLALNVFANGKQNLAQFALPFDVAAKLHTYTIRWNPTQIVWLVDGAPLRVLNKVAGKPWPTHAMQPMASVWATPWTALKADFSKGPVFATYANYKAVGCLATPTEVQKPAGLQCPGAFNLPLSAAETVAFKKLNGEAQIVDYGWDNI